MTSLDYDWIRLGFVLMCFASFTKARIDYNIAADNNIFGRETVKDARVPASTFLLDRNQLNYPSFTRDQLFRIQRHTYMLSPITYQHYNGIGKTSFPHQFNLYNPFAPKRFDTPTKISEPVFASSSITASPIATTPSSTTSTEPKPLVPKPKSARNATLKLQEKIRLQKLRNKIKRKPTSKSLEKLSRKIEPFFPSLPAPSSEQKSWKIFNQQFQTRKSTNKQSSRNSNIYHNLLPRFKVFQAVPDEDF